MSIRSVLLAVGLTLAALPALSEGGPRPEEVAAFAAAVKAAGCVVSPDNAQTIIKASGLSPDEAAAASQRLKDQGMLLTDANMNLTLVPELCK